MSFRNFPLLWLAAFPFSAMAQQAPFHRSSWPGASDVIWNSPAKDFHDAMPTGNGDVAISAWAQDNGELQFYISKSDAYDDNNRLLKLGLVKVRISPNPFAKASAYGQRLHLRQSEITIRSQNKSDSFSLRLWVDANAPVIRLEMKGSIKFETHVKLENWRTMERPVVTLGHSDSYNTSIDGSLSGQPTIQYPDSILKGHQNTITWFHQNHHSCWPFTMKLQGLEQLVSSETDPLLNNVFGATISGDGLRQQNDTALQSATAVTSQNISVIVHSEKNSNSSKWLKVLREQQSIIANRSLAKSRDAHLKWWERFWDRSFIDVQTKGDTGALITRGYVLQRYMVACSGRGEGWVKFNGALFTLPDQDPDYRKWGSAEWFQNARLVYWPLIGCGDFDILSNYYGTFLRALPLVKERTKIYYAHQGAFFSETAYSWGTYANPDYGYDRSHIEEGLAVSTYIRRHWSGGLELSAMMLEQYHFTNSEKFLTDTLLPIATEVVRFYDQHWKRTADGKIKFDPAQSLETWQTAVDPMPEIAGLQDVLTQLLALPEHVTSAELRAEWQKTLTDLPSLPMGTRDGKPILLPASAVTETSNVENPELYAIFPFRLFGVGKPSLDIAKNSYGFRINRDHNNCWYQDNAQAAYLGLTEEAAAGLAARMRDWNPAYRFPAMWGPANDELPDMDHGGVGQLALQAMIIQSDHDRIQLFPAWPKRWNVSFKVLAPGNTVITGSYSNGTIHKLVVVPESRRKDIGCDCKIDK